MIFKMKFCIVRLNDNDEGTQFDTKEEFLEELSLMIDEYEAKGESHFVVGVDNYFEEY